MSCSTSKAHSHFSNVVQCKYQLTDWVCEEDASVYNVVNQYRKKKHEKIRTDNHQRNCVTVTKEKQSI